MNIPFDKIYIIHYLKSIERRESINRQLNKLNIDRSKYEIFNAIWLPDSMVQYSKDIISTTYGRYFYEDSYKQHNDILLYNRVLSLILGHYNCIKTAYELGYEKICIFEDDFIFIDNIDLIEYTINNIPNECNIIKFSLQHWVYSDYGYEYITNKFFDKNDKIQEYKTFENTGDFENLRGCGADSYYLNRKGMKMLLDLYDNAIDTADNIFFKIDPKDIYFLKYPITYVYGESVLN